MRKQLFFFALLTIFSIQLEAQRSDIPGTIDWGPEYKEPAGSYISKLIHADRNGFYILRRKAEGMVSREKVYVEYFDQQNKLKRNVELDLRYKKKVREFEDILMIGGELYFFTSYSNQAKKKNFLFYQKLSKRLTLSKKLVNIQEIDSRNKANDGGFDFEISRDSSKVLLYSQLPYKKNQPERFALKVFDNQLQELWATNVTLPYADNRFSIEEYRVDNKGDVYLSGIVYNANRLEQRGKPTYNYVILAYTNGGSDLQEYRINPKDRFITDLTFRSNGKGELICAGFYSEKGTNTVKGACFFRIDAFTKEVLQSSFKPFDFNFVTEYYAKWRKNLAENAEKKGKKKREAELYEFALDDLIVRSDGGAVLIAEQFYVYSTYYRDFTGYLQTNYYYHYNDIIVVNIRPDGDIEWQVRIPKQQTSTNDGGYYSSYSKAVVRDRMYFIYNENRKNIQNPESDRRPRNTSPGSYSVVALTEITKDGKAQTFPLFLNKEADTATRPKICAQTGSRKMLIYGERGRKYRFANLLFE